jgi:hypothetical protein
MWGLSVRLGLTQSGWADQPGGGSKMFAASSAIQCPRRSEYDAADSVVTRLHPVAQPVCRSAMTSQYDAGTVSFCMCKSDIDAPYMQHTGQGGQKEGMAVQTQVRVASQTRKE